MSASIPETMLLSDLLKTTGYDCPEELLDKTFAEATAGGDIEVESNKAASINVSTYTKPVAVTPTSGKDAMVKATITLTNIPVAKEEIDLDASENTTYTPSSGKVYKKVVVNVPTVTALFAWKLESAEREAVVYTKTGTPTTSTKALVPSATAITESAIDAVADEFASITIGEDTYTRYTSGDIAL